MVFQSHGGVSPKIISNHPVMVALGALAPQSLSSKRPFTAASTCRWKRFLVRYSKPFSLRKKS